MRVIVNLEKALGLLMVLIVPVCVIFFANQEDADEDDLS